MSPQPDCRFDRMCRAGGIPQIKHANHARQRVADCRRDAWLAIVLWSIFVFAWRVTWRAAQVYKSIHLHSPSCHEPLRLRASREGLP